MNAARNVLIFGVRLYRWIISPAKACLFGPFGRCRFTPSCSEYALEAIQVHGALPGSWLGLKRMCRCHPWGGCGDDPVPSAPNASARTKLAREYTRILISMDRTSIIVIVVCLGLLVLWSYVLMPKLYPHKP